MKILLSIVSRGACAMEVLLQSERRFFEDGRTASVQRPPPLTLNDAHITFQKQSRVAVSP